MAEASLKEIKDFFGYESLSAFSKDWKILPETDRKDIREGLSNGTLTY